MKSNMSSQYNELLEAVVTTVARFDIFNYPLTDFEIWQYMPLRCSFEEVRVCLNKQTILEHTKSFYYLPSRQEIVTTRQTRYRDADRKIKKARRLITLITWIPWIRFVALANVIGAHNLKKAADLDLFIVTKKNRLWISKFLASAILAVLRLRPTASASQDRLCLSFLIDETALDLSNCLYNKNDWYFAYWLAGLLPLFGSRFIYEKLFTANQWIQNMLPNWQTANTLFHKRFTERKRSTELNMFNFLEKLSRFIHNKVMSPVLKEQQNRGTGVMIGDHILKLHTVDRRPIFFQMAEEKIKQII